MIFAAEPGPPGLKMSSFFATTRDPIRITLRRICGAGIAALACQVDYSIDLAVSNGLRDLSRPRSVGTPGLCFWADALPHRPFSYLRVSIFCPHLPFVFLSTLPPHPLGGETMRLRQATSPLSSHRASSRLSLDGAPSQPGLALLRLHPLRLVQADCVTQSGTAS
jgi:hypothetical protein